MKTSKLLKCRHSYWNLSFNASYWKDAVFHMLNHVSIFIMLVTCSSFAREAMELLTPIFDLEVFLLRTAKHKLSVKTGGNSFKTKYYDLH